jgi:hypothetical protein
MDLTEAGWEIIKYDAFLRFSAGLVNTEINRRI